MEEGLPGSQEPPRPKVFENQEEAQQSLLGALALGPLVWQLYLFTVVRMGISWSKRHHDAVPDGGSIVPTGLYPNAPYDLKKAQKFIQTRKLAPFFRGESDSDDSESMECPICLLVGPRFLIMTISLSFDLAISTFYQSFSLL